MASNGDSNSPVNHSKSEPGEEKNLANPSISTEESKISPGMETGDAAAGDGQIGDEIPADQVQAATTLLDKMREMSCYSGKLPLPYTAKPHENGRFKGYSSTLNISGDFQKTFQEFFTLNDDGEAVIFLTRHEIFSKTSGKRPVPWRPTKNQQDSIEFRAFACSKVQAGRRDFQKALDLFNRAVKTAPVDELGKGEELKEAYLQRAAVFFKMRRFEEAFIDIERAKRAGLDEEATPPACAMKAKYYMSRRQSKRAAYYLNLAKAAEMKAIRSKMPELEGESRLEDSEATRSAGRSGGDEKEEGQNDDQAAHNEQNLEGMDIEAPTPKDALEILFKSKRQFKMFKLPGQNRDILDASASVTLGYDQEKGRFLKASHQIMPGEVLIIERPAVVHLNPQFWDQFCFNCHLRTEQPVPCKECSMVGYCSEKCRTESWTSKGHSRECKMIGNLAEAALSPSAVMAVKVVLSFGIDAIMEAKEAIEKRTKDAQTTKPSAEKPETLLPMVPLVSSNYKAHTLLEAQKEYWSKTDIFNHGLMVAYLLLLLEEIGFFDEYPSDGNSSVAGGPKSLICSREEAMKFVAKQMLYHAFTLKSNRFALSEMKLCFDAEDPGGVPDFQYNQIGSASLSTVNLLNHACVYCATWDYTKDGLIVVRAVKPIFQGEEITLCYTCNFATQPRSVRKAQLKYLYHFECKCRACVENWPTGDVLMKHPSQFRCPKCRIKLNYSKCTKCGMDWLPTITEAGKNMMEFYAAHPKIYRPQDIPQSVVDLFARYMSLTHFLCDPNCMNHIAAADALKKSFSRDGRVLVLGMSILANNADLSAAGPCGDHAAAGAITQDVMPSNFR